VGLAGRSRVMTGPEQAREDLAEILSDGRVELGEAMAQMAERGHPAGRIDRARRALEVETVREGPPGTRQTFYWRLPDACPTCLRPYRLDVAPAATPWGSHRVGNGDYWRDEPPANEPPSLPPEVQPVPPPLPPLGPPRCSVCHRASALEPDSRCPFQGPTGRCPGTVR
jgi:hypothetical protein